MYGHGFLFFFFYCSGDYRHLHSFPTRRSSDLTQLLLLSFGIKAKLYRNRRVAGQDVALLPDGKGATDRKSTRLNSSHTVISYAVFCLKKKKRTNNRVPLRKTSAQQHKALTPER